MSTKRWRRFLTVQDSLVSLKKIWMAHEVSSKDNRKYVNYQVFLKTAKNSIRPIGKISQWMIVLMRWQNSAFWLHFHNNVLLEVGKTGCLTSSCSFSWNTSFPREELLLVFLAQTHKCCEGLSGVLTFRVHMWGKNSSLQTNTCFSGDYSLDPDY